MAIIVNLDVMMARRKITLGELAARIGITQANLSILKTGKAKAIRFNTLNAIWPSIATMEWLINRAKHRQPFHGCYVVGNHIPHRAASLRYAALRGYRCEHAFHACAMWRRRCGARDSLAGG